MKTFKETAWRSPAKIRCTSDSRVPSSLICSLVTINRSLSQWLQWSSRCSWWSWWSLRWSRNRNVTCARASQASEQRSCGWRRRRIANVGEVSGLLSTACDTGAPPGNRGFVGLVKPPFRFNLGRSYRKCKIGSCIQTISDQAIITSVNCLDRKGIYEWTSLHIR